jgi:hypothetical protein
VFKLRIVSSLASRDQLPRKYLVLARRAIAGAPVSRFQWLVELQSRPGRQTYRRIYASPVARRSAVIKGGMIFLENFFDDRRRKASAVEVTATECSPASIQ